MSRSRIPGYLLEPEKYNHLSKYKIFYAEDWLKHNVPTPNIDDYNLATPHVDNDLSYYKKLVDTTFLYGRDDNKTGEHKINNQSTRWYNAITLCEWYIPIDRNLSVGRFSSYIENAYNYLSSVYEKPSIISAWVYPNAEVPYMSFRFVPIIFDEKNGRDKICNNAYHYKDRVWFISTACRAYAWRGSKSLMTTC